MGCRMPEPLDLTAHRLNKELVCTVCRVPLHRLLLHEVESCTYFNPSTGTMIIRNAVKVMLPNA